MPEVVCASPGYLKEFGTPRHPDELAAHQAVGFFSSQQDIQYPFTFLKDGNIVEYKVGGWISVDDAECYTTAALQGCGLVQVPRFRIEDHLQAGRLVQVLADWPCPDLPLSVMYPYHRQLSPRVKVFVEWVAAVYLERFGPAP